MPAPTEQQIKTLRADLASVKLRDGLQVLSAVSAIPVRRLQQIIDGAAPTVMEVTTINMLK
jgi:hypothetical protein